MRTAPCSPRSFNVFSVALPFRELNTSSIPPEITFLPHVTPSSILRPRASLLGVPELQSSALALLPSTGTGFRHLLSVSPVGPRTGAAVPAGALHLLPNPPSWLRRGARPSFRPPSLPLSAGRVSARPWAWLKAAARAGLGVSHSAGGAESRARRHTEAAGAGGCGAASGRGRLAAAPRPPTHTCCRAAVSWSAASSPAAADDLFARRQPLRSPGVPARAGDAPSAARSPAQPARRAAASAAGSRSPGGAAP